MNSPQLKRPLLVALVALVVWPAVAWAETTLGRSQGIALIGRSLEVTVPIALEPGTDPSTLCVDADVFYADSRVGASRVNARVEAGGIGRATLRITAAQPIDEPVVTVYVRFGCSDKLTRRYVLLAEQPVDAGFEAAAPLPRPGARAGATAPSATATPPARAPVAVRPRPSAAVGIEAARPPVDRPRARAAAAAPVQPRLKLEPPDLGLVPDTGLRLSGALSEVAEAASPRRAEAAASWQSMNTRSEDVLLTARRLEALEGDMKLLREALLKDKSSITTLRSELDRAKSERYANPVVYGLVALILATLAAMVWLSRRKVRPAEPDRDWWRGRGAIAVTDFDAADEASTLRVASRPADPHDTEGSGLDLSFTQSGLDKLQTPGVHGWQGGHPGAGGASEQASSRAVNAEELSDIQQQADFFVSLGEYEQAIDVLRGHIQAYPEASALTWLDLLDLHHKLQRRSEYEQIRSEFHRTFNAQVPSFDAYREQSAGLEAYPSALTRISALWPSPKVLDIIEDSIFRKPSDSHGEAFGLEAYRELLLLHHIGKEVIEAGLAEPDDFERLGPRTSGFSNTSIQPLSAALGTHPGFMPSSFELSRIGLDINLDEPVVDGSRPGLRGGSTLGSGHLLDFDLTSTELPEIPARRPV